MDFASEARIETSTLCNHRCIFCTHPQLQRKKEVMSFDLFKHIVSEVQKQPSITQITLSGFGEAFSDKDILKKVEYVSNLGYDINILTNGTLLSENKIDSLFEFNIKNFRISIHSSSAKEFARITGTNEKNYNKLLNICKYISTKNNNVNFTVTAVVDGNENEVGEIINTFQPYTDNLDIWKPHNWSVALSYRSGIAAKLSCGRPLRGPLQVQVDGTVNMCCFDYDGHLTIGDLKTQSIDEIFQSDGYRKILHHHTVGDYANSGLICENCDQRIEYDGLIYSTKKGRTNMFSSSYERMENE